jgi:UDP-2,4-diacetamido-2,4,6-trideoxy-beta-L-altropyranose hydrolase
VGGSGRGHLVTPRALLAADCGRGVGLGHLERMLALADNLRPDVEVVVLIPDGDQEIRRRVGARGHTTLEGAADTPARVTAAVDASSPFDVVVLDGYVFDVELQRRLRDHAPLTVVDDLALPADCDLAVNPSPGGEALRPVGATTFLGGAAYALIRASVVQARELALQRGRDARSVLVSTGATDAAGLGRSLTFALLDRDPTVEVTRVVGPDSMDQAGDARPRERVVVAPPDLADGLATATVYVGAAGTTAVQAACVGCPAVITATASNQNAQAAALAAAGCAVVADAGELADACLSLLDDPARRAQMAVRGRDLVDGQGASRVADAIRHLVAARAA